MEKAYSYRFYPTPEQESLLRRTLGCVRLVYNKALHLRTQAWYERQERVGYTETSSMLTDWKKQEELDFLNEVSCVPLQQGLRHLQTAFTNFFAGRKYLGKINYILASKIVQHFFNVSEEALSVFIGAKFNPFIF